MLTIGILNKEAYVILLFRSNIITAIIADEAGISTFMSIPGSIGEIGICLWLLIVGIKAKRGAFATIDTISASTK